MFGSAIEAEFIVGAAVEINRQVRRLGTIAHDGEGTFFFPVGRVERVAEGTTYDHGNLVGLLLGRFELRQLIDQGRTVRAYRPEQLRVFQPETQRPITTHRNPGNSPLLADGANPVMAFDERNKFLNEESLVAHFSVARIDVKRAAGVGRDQQEFADFIRRAKIFHFVGYAGVHQDLFVPAQAMQKI